MAISPLKGSRECPMPDEGLSLELQVSDGLEKSPVLNEERSSSASRSTPESLQASRHDQALLGQEMRMKSHKRGRASLENEPSSAVQSTGQLTGVVFQTNGKWGAQIYAKHARKWLGTFNSRKEAALAYDRASIKLKGKYGIRNLPNEPILETESDFQNKYTDEEVVQMIKDRSYDEKLEQMTQDLNLRISTEQGEPNLQQLGSLDIGSSRHKEHLFQKVLTISDVNSQNRLVIPKRQALRHFPTGFLDNEENKFLTFLDSDGKEWKFKFTHWENSDSYVLTRGWKPFVNAKKLKAGYTVSFARDSTMAVGTFYITVRSPQKGKFNSQCTRKGFHPTTNSTIETGTNPENSLAMSPSAPSTELLDSMRQVRDPGAISNTRTMLMHFSDSEPAELVETQNRQRVQGNSILHFSDSERPELMEAQNRERVQGNLSADDEDGKQSMIEKTDNGNGGFRLFGVTYQTLMLFGFTIQVM